VDGYIECCVTNETDISINLIVKEFGGKIWSERLKSKRCIDECGKLATGMDLGALTIVPGGSHYFRWRETITVTVRSAKYCYEDFGPSTVLPW
jgi:hypothetical protein